MTRCTATDTVGNLRAGCSWEDGVDSYTNLIGVEANMYG